MNHVWCIHVIRDAFLKTQCFKENVILFSKKKTVVKLTCFRLVDKENLDFKSSFLLKMLKCSWFPQMI